MKTLMFAVAILTASAAAAVNVPNGDFSAGNTNFTSDYGYGPGAGALLTAGANSGAGYYSVADNAQFSHPYFTSFGDHTSGTGLYLIANGAIAPGVTVYRSATIAVQAGKTYSFGAYLANAYPASPANIDFTVALGGGAATSIGTVTIPDGSGVWNSAAKTFNTGTATSVTLSFVDRNLASSGNDFAIDDITLRAVPEPATWVMMIAGFGLVGVGLRRRTPATA